MRSLFVLAGISSLTVPVSLVGVEVDAERPNPDANVRDDAIEVAITEQESGEGESDGGGDSGDGEAGGSEGDGSAPERPVPPGPSAPEGPADPADGPGAPTTPQVHYCYVEGGELDDYCAQFANTFCDGVGTIQQDWEPEEGAVIGNAECGSDDTTQPAAPEESTDEAEAPPSPVITQEDLAQLPIQVGDVAFEPDLLGFGYVNRYTNVFAQVESQIISREMLGYEVDIRAIPVEFHWDYGDGATRITYEPGAPITDGDAAARTDVETLTSHAYEQTGRYEVGLSTTFIGEYRIDGGPWTAIYGNTTIASSPGEADIWQLSSRNVDSSCEQQGAWGCNGPVELAPGEAPPTIFEDQYDDGGNWIGSP